MALLVFELVLIRVDQNVPARIALWLRAGSQRWRNAGGQAPKRFQKRLVDQDRFTAEFDLPVFGPVRLGSPSFQTQQFVTRFELNAFTGPIRISAFDTSVELWLSLLARRSTSVIKNTGNASLEIRACYKWEVPDALHARSERFEINVYSFCNSVEY